MFGYICVDCARKEKTGPSSVDVAAFRQRAAAKNQEAEETRRVLAANFAVAEPTVSEDPYEKLRKLAELRDDGVITIDEFERKKSEILADI